MADDSGSILLRGGTILQHGPDDRIHVLQDTDLLIEGEHISKIGKNLVASEHAKVIDCDGKVVSPGFVDTHHHVWQTQLKGRHTDDTLLDYTAKGNWQPFNYTATDVFWGELGGLLEAIDGGTTCIVDHAHMAYSASHGVAGFAATLTAGIRSVFCLSLTPRLDKWDTQVVANGQLLPDWFFPLLDDLEKQCRQSRGKVAIGFGFDSYTLPSEEVIRIFESARKAGAKVITSHWRRNNIAGKDLVVHAHRFILLALTLCRYGTVRAQGT
jgi:cytosine/adenosine deaminase-related metal-dependent hydrolase